MAMTRRCAINTEAIDRRLIIVSTKKYPNNPQA
jgi:hypothetical protein